MVKNVDFLKQNYIYFEINKANKNELFAKIAVKNHRNFSKKRITGFSRKK